MKFNVFYDISKRFISFYITEQLSNKSRHDSMFKLSRFLDEEFGLAKVSIRHALIRFIFSHTDFDDMAVMVKDLQRFHQLVNLLMIFEEDQEKTKYVYHVDVDLAFNEMKYFIITYFAPYVHCWSIIPQTTKIALLNVMYDITALYVRSYTCYKAMPNNVDLSAEDYGEKLQAMIDVMWIILFEQADEIVRRVIDNHHFTNKDYMIPLGNDDSGDIALLLDVIYNYITTE